MTRFGRKVAEIQARETVSGGFGRRLLQLDPKAMRFGQADGFRLHVLDDPQPEGQCIFRFVHLPAPVNTDQFVEADHAHEVDATGHVEIG